MTREDRLPIVAQRYVDAKKYSSVAWHVEKDGTALSKGQLGLANVLSGQALPENPLYRIYSMTKPVVSLLALQLVEEGRLRLYSPLSGFDPAFGKLRVLHPDGRLEPLQRPIMVEDLLTHRAGFTYEFITGCHVAPLYLENDISGDGLCSLEEMMERLSQLPLAFQPGSMFRYSVASAVLAYVIERATGQGLEELLKERIFEPLGMKETTFCLSEAQKGRLMPMFGANDLSEFFPLNPTPHKLSEEVNVDNMYPVDKPDFRRGGHGLYSTTDDYVKFARMLLDGRGPDGEVILSRKMLEMMRSNRIPPSQLPMRIGMMPLPGYGFGLGVRVLMDAGQAIALSGEGEIGWAGAADTYFFVDPAERLFGVFMTQYLGSMQPLAEDLRTAAYLLLD